MFGSINQLMPAITGVLGVATVWADAGYLPRSGPPSLRFREPPPPVVKQVEAPFPPPFLPPFFPAPEPIALPTPPMPQSPPDMTSLTNDPPPPASVTNEPALEFDARDFAIDPAALPGSDMVVSPQMLLKYFALSNNVSTNAGKNTLSARAIAPLGFLPPMVPVAAPTPPQPPPASKATYSTSPDAK